MRRGAGREQGPGEGPDSRASSRSLDVRTVPVGAALDVVELGDVEPVFHGAVEVSVLGFEVLVRRRRRRRLGGVGVVLGAARGVLARLSGGRCRGGEALEAFHGIEAVGKVAHEIDDEERDARAVLDWVGKGGFNVTLQIVSLAMTCVKERVHSSRTRREMISRPKR